MRLLLFGIPYTFIISMKVGPNPVEVVILKFLILNNASPVVRRCRTSSRGCWIRSAIITSNLRLVPNSRRSLSAVGTLCYRMCVAMMIPLLIGTNEKEGSVTTSLTLQGYWF